MGAAGPPSPGAAVPGTAAAPPFDLVSALTVAGVERPKGLDWKPEVGESKASKIFKNVKTLGEVTGNRFMAGMQSMEANLGVKCKHCHEAPKDWSSDVKPTKQVARDMFTLTYGIDRDFFKGTPRVSCYTCHRGHDEPPPSPEKISVQRPDSAPVLTAAEEDKPADEVFMNLLLMKKLPAKRLLAVMDRFSAALGVPCKHCHVEGKWDLDDRPEKKRAREMMQMSGQIHERSKDLKQPINCTTCHQGSPKPAQAPGPVAAAP